MCRPARGQQTDAMSTTSFQCPNCAAPVGTAADACAACGMRLSGPAYERLWWVLGQIHSLQVEADQLKAALLAPTAAVPGGPSFPSGRRQGLSGQQVMLALGALLVLAASSIFLLAVWFLVGIYGQAMIMAGLTAAAVQGGRLAARRGLDAASETGAVIATGMVLLDVLGARRFGLFGLHELSPALFGALATALVGGLLLGFDRIAPRATRDGASARRPVSYRPAAAVLFAATPWFLVVEAEPRYPSLVFLAAVLLVAVAQAATAAGFWVLSGRRVTLPVIGLGSLAAAAYGLHLVLAFGIAHDIGNSTTLRYGALGFLLVVLVVLFVATRRRLVPEAAVVAVALVLATVPVADLTGWAVVVAAVLTTVVLVVLLGLPARAARTGALVLLWMLAGTGLVLSLTDGSTLHRPGSLTGPTSATDAATGLLPVGLVALVALWALARTRHPAWMLQAQVAVVLVTGRALAETDREATWWLVTIALAVIEGALATYASTRRAEGKRLWPALEGTALGLAALYVLVAFTAAVGLDAYWVAATCFTVGAVLVGYATSPGRFGVAYLGAVANAMGGWVLTAEAGVETVEVYSLPLAAMLAVLGVLHGRRVPTLPTTVTMGPALGVLAGPSLLVAVLDGDSLRLALVTAGGVAALLVGYTRRWQAPVAVGALVVGVIGVTQGGPYVAQIPGWVTLGLGGTLLLVAGVRWEAAVKAGRRGSAWFGSLR